MTSFQPRPSWASPAVSGGVGVATAHESAIEHVSGAALYTSDLVGRHASVLHAWPISSPHAHARVTTWNIDAARQVPGVVTTLTADDVPGVNDGGVRNDEPLFPDVAQYVGQAMGWVLAESLEQARLGAEEVTASSSWEILDALVGLDEAIAKGSLQGATSTIHSGDDDISTTLENCEYTFSGTSSIPGQEHFYLETHASLATVDESGTVFIQCSTQHPTETQEIVAHVLGVPSHTVTVQCLRMGGGFGGKEMQPHGLAAVAALGAVKTMRPVSLRLNRTQDITMTGKRHPFHAAWEVGFDGQGRLQALDVTLTADGGWSLDLSEAVLARALCHVDNAYALGTVRATGRIARTNKTSQTAFRGFGGPQGMFVIEDILGTVAPLLGLSPEELRRRNLYRAGGITHYGQPVRHPERMHRLWEELIASSSYDERRAAIDVFNASHPNTKRGLAITPVKFGISFNFTAFNQAGALAHIYKDGSVLINHGGTEMGQGLHTKMIQVAATTLGVPPERIRLAPTRTDKVPNTSATAASSGTDLNGAALASACTILRERLAVVAAGLFDDETGEAGDDTDSRAAESVAELPKHAQNTTDPHDVFFTDGHAYLPDGRSLSWEEVVRAAYFARVSLSQNGFYATPGLSWDKTAMRGEPFKYFTYGAAVAEVEVDGFTGQHHTRRVDILHDVGSSISPLIDRGQLEGGFVQGAGWLTLEDLRWDETSGRLLTQAASTYKLPSLSEMPDDFRVDFLTDAEEDGVIYGSKAVGEPPLMLAFSVREALRDAASAFASPAQDPRRVSVHLQAPTTPEAMWWAIQSVRSHDAGEKS